MDSPLNSRKPKRGQNPPGRKPGSPPGGSSKGGGKKNRKPKGAVGVRRLADGSGWELVHPRGAIERADDMLQVHQMVEHGETEIAMDELRWLLGGCPEFIEAHAVLGELALAENDMALARGHFGLAFQVGQKAVEGRQLAVPLPYSRPTNQAFYSAGKGLVWCLLKADKREMAENAARFLLECDPSDPLNVKELLTRTTL